MEILVTYSQQAAMEPLPIDGIGLPFPFRCHSVEISEPSADALMSDLGLCCTQIAKMACSCSIHHSFKVDRPPTCLGQLLPYLLFLLSNPDHSFAP